MIFIISGLVVIMSFLGLVFFAWRYWAQLQSLDSESLREFKESQIKNQILQTRLKRKILWYFEKGWKFIRPGVVNIKDIVRSRYHWLMEQERHWREVADKLTFQKKTAQEQRKVLSTKLNVAESHHDKEKTKEEKYLEVLALDPKNTSAYEGLASIYFRQKDFLHAREIYQFIIKLRGEQAEYLLDMANCWVGEQDYKEAVKILRQALKLEPKNPKIIDTLVETAILMKDFVIAKSYLQQLKEVNPDNKKISEFQAQIAKLKAFA